MAFRYAPPVRGMYASEDSVFAEGEVETEKKVIDTEKDGTQLYKEDVIKFVTEELEKRRTERSPLENQWTLNANFLVGNQYCDINTYRGNIEQLEPVYDWLERETFNQIAPLIETRISNLKKIKYLMKVNPRTNELDDYAKAEVSTAVLQHTQSVSDFDSKKNTMIAWNELCGNCFWLSWWDSNKGEKYAVKKVVAIGEDGMEKNDEEAFYEGDLDYGLITPYEIYPESIFKQGIDSQRSVILEQVKTVDDIYDLYGVEVEGTNIETFELTPVGSGGGFGYESTVLTIGHRTVDNAEKVITYFERPSKHRPDGRMIIIIGDKEIVYYGNLPYNRIPLNQVICREIAGQFFGKSVIEDLIPRQRAFNGCVNRIHEFIKRVAIQSFSVEEGSIDIEEYEANGLTPGYMLVYKQGSQAPKPIENGNLPSEIMMERQNLIRDMEYVAGVSQLMTSGSVPTGVTSGRALESIKETDDTRLSLTGDHIRNSIRNLAKMWLQIYKLYANARRIINYVGTNSIGSAIIWSAQDINSYDVEYVTENELLMSEEMQKQRFFEAYNLGLFTDATGKIPERVKQRALEYMRIGNYTEIMNLNLLQIQAAQRENVFFENGALPEISDFDDDEIHYEEHLRYILQMNFQILKMKKPEYAAALEGHAMQHFERKERKQMMAVMPEGEMR
ncbi:MAG: hypothetical protein M0R40_00630 [Firmicutes bacterium]|nr:hypothetical protein [Bacillota bacterium]